MSFDYRIYGLNINSSEKISLLPDTANKTTDISIYWTTDESNTPFSTLNWERFINKGLENRKRLHVFTATTDEGTFYNLNYFTDTGSLLFILNPLFDKMWIVYSNDEPKYNIESILVGPALGAIQRLKGVICLHSSVINIDGKAVAFIGQKRAGKSTMAAAFVKNGHNVIADDLAVLTERDGSISVFPGYPKVRLRPQSLLAIHNDKLETFQQVYPNRDSRYTDIEHRFEKEPLPLRAIYILSPADDIGTTPEFEPVNAAQKMVRVMEHSFAAYMLNSDLKKEEFSFFARLTMLIPIRKINFEHNLDFLDTNCSEIVKDFRMLN